MVTSGPDHYKAAEDHLTEAFNHHWGSAEEQYNLAAAQVHATLALAAAQALPLLDWRDNAVKGNGLTQNLAWREAIQ
jgi:hypothetical protein